MGSSGTGASPCKSTFLEQTLSREAELSQLVDHTCFLLLAHNLLHYPSVFNELPREFVAEFLKRGHDIGLAKETVGETCVHLRNGKQK